MEELPFAGVDGEGGSVDGAHEYLLLRAGNRVLETGLPLTSKDCLSFISGLPKGYVYVAFAFDYDVTMILRGVEWECVQRLFDRPSREYKDKEGKGLGRYRPVKVLGDQYEIDYLPRKEFKVRKKGGNWVTINDTFTFFQASFVTTLRKWFGDEPGMEKVIERIAIGKELRHDYGAVDEDEREYNQLECVMLEELMERFRTLCSELDIFPKKWQGPGNLVSAVFRREGVPGKKERRIPAIVEWNANNAYYGGRFEVAYYGLIDKKIWQYDINSAYASSYKGLPCLVHGKWAPIRELPNDGCVYLAQVWFKHDKKLYWNTLPVRSKKGTLLFPNEGRGWYWGSELDVAKKHGARIEVVKGWRYEKNCDCAWFDWVYKLYDERNAVGKTSGKGKVLKTVLATIYGKLAQSVGNPVWANPIWAGIVVSECRAKLIDAALQMGDGRDVCVLATDGLFASTPRVVDVGEDLGQWSVAEHDELFVVQSGVYFVPGEMPKTRGVPRSRVIDQEQDFRDVWREWVATGDVERHEPGVNVRLNVFRGLKLANALNRSGEAGHWLDTERRIRFDWSTKRYQPVIHDQHVLTLPVPGHATLTSQPPQKRIGGQWDAEKMFLDEQPDWGDQLIWE